MDEVRCPHCGAVPAVPEARFCHACGGVIRPVEELAPGPSAEEPWPWPVGEEPSRRLPAGELPPSPPDEPPPPPAPEDDARRGRAGRRFAPLAVGLAGLGLLIGGIATAAGAGDDRDLSSVLRTSGVLVPSTTSVPGVPSPSETLIDFSGHHDGTGTTTTTTGQEGAVALAEDFADNEGGWLTGESQDGTVTRYLVDGVYRVSLAPSDSSVLAYTWKPGFGSLVDLRVDVEAVHYGAAAAACGLGLLAADDYPRLALLVDAMNGRFRVVARPSSEVPVEELIGWTESPTIEQEAVNSISLIFQDGDVWLFINDLLVGKLDAISFDPAQVAMVARGPGGGQGGACDFDDLVVREP